MSGFPVLVDAPEADANWRRKVRIVVNQLIAFTSQGGTTAQRPARPTSGQPFYDETLGIPIWWNAAAGQWRDSQGTPV